MPDEMPKNAECRLINRRRRKFLVGVGAVGVTALAGCGTGDGGTGDDGTGDGGTGGDDQTGTTESGDLAPVTVATPLFGLWNTSRVHIVGTEMGFFEEEGIEVRRPDTGGGGSNVRLVTTGDADICVESGIMASLAAHREGAPVKIPSSTAAPEASDLVWFSAADSKYETLEDCTDASIGFSSPGSSTNMVAEGAIEHGNLENAEAVSMGGPSANYTAVLNGEVDVGWSTPIQVREGEQAGEVKEVFNGGEIPPFDSTTIRTEIVNANWLEENPEPAKAYFRAQARCLEWERENPGEAAELWANVIDHDNPDLLAQVIENAYPGDDPSEIHNIEAAQELAVEHEFIDSPLSDNELDSLIDLSYLP